MNKATLVAQIFEKQSMLCVGLDPELTKIPPHLLEEKDPVFEFCKAIIDATNDLCVAYKPNLAFFEALGMSGWKSLQKIVDYIGDQHLVIADAKRGDIGNTSRMYAKAMFEKLGADAITVAPYMGRDSVEPFLGFADKWAVVLGLTSNMGSEDFQQQKLATGEYLYERVLKECATWGNPESLMFVIGATKGEKFAEIRKILPDHFLLVPGIGAQGGSLEAVCKYGINKEGGLLINSSRGIIYASQGEDYAEKARVAALELQQEMWHYLQKFI
jgi:orotidine-5'-phosphate decarboxylase